MGSCDADVAGQGQVAAAAERRAVDRRDHRHPQRRHAVHEPLHTLDELPGGGLVGDLLTLVEVAAGAEVPSGSDDDDNARIGVLDRVQGVLHGLHERVRQRVARRTLHSQYEDLLGVVNKVDQLLGHVSPLTLPGSRATSRRSTVR